MASKGKTRRYSLREEKRRILAENPPIEIELDDFEGDRPEGEGVEVIHVRAAVNWDDDTLALTQKDPIAAATSIIIEAAEDADVYERFVSAGGSANILFAIAGQTDQGADAGE